MVEFNRIVLDNGLTILHEKRDVNVTTVMLATKFGSLYEEVEEKGIAHFIEHLAFKGTKNRSALQIAFELERVGGVLNAFTDEEETAFHVKLPSGKIDLAIDVIFDIFFNPIFPEEEVKKEAKVICEEIKMYKDSPARHVINKIKECLYEPPFGLFGAGDEETVLKLTKTDLVKKHSRFYNPQNSILCVVGNNSFEEVVSLAKKFSSKNKSDFPYFKEIKLQNFKKIEKRPEVEQANIVIGMHMPISSSLDKASSEVFSTILGGGMSSKLFTEIREKRGLAYAVKTFLEKGKNYSYLGIYIGTEKSKVDEVIKICLEEFKKMGEISLKELEDGKQQLLGNYEVDSESSDSAALHLILSEIAGKAEDYYNFKELVNLVSLKDIKKISEIKDYASFVLS